MRTRRANTGLRRQGRQTATQLVSLAELTAAHAAKNDSEDRPVQVVVHPENLARLQEEAAGDGAFEADGQDLPRRRELHARPC